MGTGRHAHRAPIAADDRSRPRLDSHAACVIALPGLLAALGVSACGDTVPTTDVCTGVTCSSHGHCVSDGIAPRCACDPGFLPLGLECLATSADGDADGDGETDEGVEETEDGDDRPEDAPVEDAGPACWWEEDFASFDAASYYRDSDCSTWSTAGQYYVVTDNTLWCRSRIFYTDTTFDQDRFSVSFDVWIATGPVLADGLTMALVEAPGYLRTGTDCDRANCGGYLDFEGAVGYAVELDTYFNVWDPVPGPHLAVIKNGAGTHLASWPLAIDYGAWNEVVVRFDNGQFAVAIDGVTVLETFDPDAEDHPPWYVGFTSGSGNFALEQRVDNICVGPA